MYEAETRASRLSTSPSTSGNSRVAMAMMLPPLRWYPPTPLSCRYSLPRMVLMGKVTTGPAPTLQVKWSRRNARLRLKMLKPLVIRNVPTSDGGLSR